MEEQAKTLKQFKSIQFREMKSNIEDGKNVNPHTGWVENKLRDQSYMAQDSRKYKKE